MKCHFLFLVVMLSATAFSEKVRYDNYQVYRITPRSAKQVATLHQMEQSNEYNFWTAVNKIFMPVDVMVPPHKILLFDEFLKKTNMQHSVQIRNVQQLINQEEARLTARSLRPKQLEWTDYHPLEEVYDWLDKLAAEHDNVETVVGGKSYEDRDIKGIEINNGDDLPGVVIESGIHAREWITVAASSWIINEILKSPADSVWRQFNFLYFPSVNPDGYAFTWTNDRLWRRTRTPYHIAGFTCYGADPNRNWGSHWGEGGSSDIPCTETYAGPTAFSELETKSLSDYLTSVRDTRRNDIYVAYHSYSQLLMFPWGYTSQHTPSHDVWQRIGDAAAADLLAVHGTKFAVGNIYDTIYQTSGTSTEWYYGGLNATLSYVYEMRDTGRDGFLLPPEQIIPAGEEHLVSLERILIEYQNLKK